MDDTAKGGLELQRRRSGGIWDHRGRFRALNFYLTMTCNLVESAGATTHINLTVSDNY
jgi:hypothetical protein